LRSCSGSAGWWLFCGGALLLGWEVGNDLHSLLPRLINFSAWITHVSERLADFVLAWL
jgi:hypothetical protein